jgi:hypothetical protein
MSHKTAVLISPLDWGLGHASRVISVIRQYIGSGHKVIIGGDGKSLELLMITFPDIQYLNLPSYRVRYYGKGFWLILSLLWQMPLLIFSILKEHLFIQKTIQQYNIGMIISDNRYGLFSRKIPCIFITHQISPVLPLILKPLEYPLYLIIRGLIERFNECWIPDFEGNQNISGKLSHRYKLPGNARFIGLLSRFNNLADNLTEQKTPKYDLVIVLSGPQPSLHNFTLFITQQAIDLKLKTLIIGGLQNNYSIPEHIVHVEYRPHVPPEEFKAILVNAGYIICRAGYSGIMDLISINRTALIIPTEGQSEQEYLASYMSEKEWFCTVNESSLNLKKDLLLLNNIIMKVTFPGLCKPPILQIPIRRPYL